jgi:phage terminase large subunit GpA-like protein
MREPMDRIGDHSVKELHWLWSPGGGKTTGIEGIVQWRMENQPSNVLLVGQKDDTAERWMETRMLPSIRKNPELKNLLPSAQGKDRHKIRKTTVIFNHGFYLEAGGSAESNLQEKSMPMVIFEEAWKISQHPGRIQQGKQRTHDKWDALILYVGQAGETHIDPDNDETLTDLYREWLRTDQRTFCFECPDCGLVQPWKWDQMKWDKVEIEGYGVDWDKTAETVRLRCASQECGTEWADTIRNRRMLADSGRYVVGNPNAQKGCVGYHANAMCYWRIPWAKLVQQFDAAMEAKYKGDLSLLQVFIMQRLCEFWTPMALDERHELATGGYKVEEFAAGELIDGEEGRGIAVDVQQNELWFTISALGGDGRVQVLNCGQALTFEEIEEKRKAYKVNPKCVLVDSQYRQDYVFQRCAEFGWTAYRGVAQESFQVNVGGEMVRMPFSKVIPVQSGNGKKTTVINFCVNPIKDVIAEMRARTISTPVSRIT